MRAALVRIAGLFAKEIEIVLRDPRSRFVVIVPPIVQLFVFGYAATFDVVELDTVLLDEDRTVVSRELAHRFDASRAFRITESVRTERDLREAISSGRVRAGLRIGQTFGDRIERDGGATVQLLFDGRNSNTALVALGYARRIVEAFDREMRLDDDVGSRLLRVVPRAWFNPTLRSRWFFVPGIVVLLSLVVTLVLTALSVAREREEGTFDQLLVTPLRPIEILAGKALSAASIGLAEAFFTVLVARFWFGVPYVGQVGWLFATLALWLLSAVGAGLFLSSLARTQQQAVLFAFLFLVPTILLSGFGTPVENMPDWLQRATLANPMRHCLVVVRGLFLADPPADVLAPHLGVMATVAVASLTAATWLFRARSS